MVATRALSRSYATAAEVVWAVCEVDLTVEPGEFVCILGASGSGKSTLLHLIAGLDSPTGGSVHVSGLDVGAAGEAERSRLRLEKVGVVFQEHNLIEEFTALENVMLPLEALGARPRAAAEAARAALAQVGIDELDDRLPHELSGGQKQRVGIARAIVGDKALVLADEPTGALDSRTSRALFETLRALCDEGATAVVATHDLVACEYADSVHRIEDGRLRLHQR